VSGVRRADGFFHSRVGVGEVTLHVAEARPAGGTKDAPLVVLLHGFPEHWWSWRHQMRALAAAGFWAVAPDMRGYNESDKPAGVHAYEVERLADDVAGLVRALGREDAIVVGHDWGAVVAWNFAQIHPAMTKRLAILNVPHPLAMNRGLRRLEQLKKSWYIFFFQLPGGIPERAIAKDDFAYIRRMFRADRFPPEEVEAYVDALRVPGALTAALSYYRAVVRRVAKGTARRTTPIECPVLVIWGDRDRYLGRELAEPPARFVPNARVVHLPEANHWVQNVAATEVNELLLAFARGA
jgi:pimeloyl-ACP methyl ester carboxylesterase